MEWSEAVYNIHTHTIHVWYIYLYICLFLMVIYGVHVGKYTMPYLDAMGQIILSWAKGPSIPNI